MVYLYQLYAYVGSLSLSLCVWKRRSSLLELATSLLLYVGIFVALQPLYRFIVLLFVTHPIPHERILRWEGRSRGFNLLRWNSMPYVIFIWIRLWITRYAKELCRGIKFDIQMDDTSSFVPRCSTRVRLDLDRSERSLLRPRDQPTPPPLFFSPVSIFLWYPPPVRVCVCMCDIFRV